MTDVRRRIAVIGGGITGLSAAYYAAKACRERGAQADITIIEQSGRLGGKIRTLHRDGCVIEQGPDSFLARKRPIVDLTDELGISGELVALNPSGRQTYMLRRGKLHPMPDGLMLGIPTKLMPFAKTGLIGPLGKLRAALDIVLPRRSDPGDESLGDFLRRRLGSDVLDHIAEPLLAGIYAGNTRELSLQATFPQFQEMERKHRSLMLGMMRSRMQPPLRGAAPPLPLPEAVRGSMFLSYKRGLGTLVEALGGELGACRQLLGCEVASLSRAAQGVRVQFGGGGEETFDAAVIAVPNYAAAAMLPPDAAAQELIGIPYASVANVVLAFRASDVSGAMAGSGFLVPKDEGLAITACTWTSAKWGHTAPDGLALLRCYVGRSGDERALALGDGELKAAVLADLRRTMGITAVPQFVEITRWERSMPQYPVGHLQRLGRFRAQLAEVLPGAFAAGSGYEGVGLPDCIGQGKQAAGLAVDYALSGSPEVRG